MRTTGLCFLIKGVAVLVCGANQYVMGYQGKSDGGFLAKQAIQDTSKIKNVVLPEVAVAGVKSVQSIGLTNLPPDSGYRGKTGERIAVFIPHPITTTPYQVTAITLNVKKKSGSFDAKFEEGELRIRLCKAVDVNHPPSDSTLIQDLIINPQIVRESRTGYLEIPLSNPVLLPKSGLFVVAAWRYERNSKDAKTGSSHSATLAATYTVSQSYTWTSVGDLIQTWQREGEKNSITEITQRQGLFPQWKNKVYNALMGVKVKQVD